MGSTFMGLETARRGLTTQQSALYTTGNQPAYPQLFLWTRNRNHSRICRRSPEAGTEIAWIQ